MTTARVLLAGLAVAVGSIAAAPTADASCLGPTIATSSASVSRGQTITVQGSGFGDNCYDTGPPPPGEGALGTPTSGIEIVVSQGTTDVVVARGDADATYAFTVDVVVPSTLQPGPAAVSARSSQPPTVVAPQPLTISDQPPSADAHTVASFGPNVTTSTVGSSDSIAPLVGEPVEPSSSGGSTWALPLIVAIGVGAAAAIVLRRRSARQS